MCGARGVGRAGRRAAGRHFAVLEEPRYTSVSGGCSLAVRSVPRAAPRRPAATRVPATWLRSPLAISSPATLCIIHAQAIDKSPVITVNDQSKQLFYTSVHLFCFYS